MRAPIESEPETSMSRNTAQLRGLSTSSSAAQAGRTMRVSAWKKSMATAGLTRFMVINKRSGI